MKPRFANEELGSYNFEKFTDKSAELARLEHQATVALNLEMSRYKELLGGLDPASNIIDVGCGTGHTTLPLAQRCAQGKTLGLDPSEELLAIARDLMRSQNVTNTEFRYGSIYELGQYKEQYDIAVSRLVFQHLTRPQEAVRQLLSTVKPGGYALIMDIDFGWLSIYPEHEIFEQFLSLSGKNHADPFVGHKLASYLEEAGAADIKVHVEPLTQNHFGGGIAGFLAMLLPFFSLLIDDADIPRARRDELMNELIEDMQRSPHAYGIIGIFAVRGRVPQR